MSINDNWLTEAVQDCRESNDQRLPRRERLAEVSCIIQKIKDHERGPQFLVVGEYRLTAAIEAGLDAADKVTDGKSDEGKPSAAQAFVLLMCDSLGIEYGSI